MARGCDLRDWQERCDCRAIHDTYNGEPFPLSECRGRECRTKVCCECKHRCEECKEDYCKHCSVVFEVNGKEHTMCFKCIVMVADEAMQEATAA